MASLAQRIAQIRRGLARGNYSAQHKTRAQIELGKLQARRHQNFLDRTMYNPEAILSGKALRQTVNQIVQSEVDPLGREQARIGAQAKANVGQIDQLFKDLAASQAATSARAAQISQSGQATQQNIANQQNQALQNTAQQADQMLGGPSNPYTQGARAQLTQLVTTQQGQAAAQQSAQATASNQIGTNAEQLANAMGASNQMRGPELASLVQRQATSDINELGAKIADIRGPGRAKILSDLILGERNYLGAAKALNLNVEKFKEEKHKNRADARIAYAKLKEDAKHNRITEKQLGQRLLIEQQNADTAKDKAYWDNKIAKWKLDHPNITLTKGGKGSGKGGAAGATPLQRRNNYNTFADVVAYVKQNPGAQPGDIGAPSGNNLLYKIANDPAYKKTGKIPRKYYSALHTRFPGILTKGR